jgi:hypothetical protein
MRVRPAVPEDRSQWLPLWQGYQPFYRVDLTSVTDTTWARFHDPAEPIHCAVAERDGVDGPRAPLGVRLIGTRTHPVGHERLQPAAGRAFGLREARGGAANV